MAVVEDLRSGKARDVITATFAWNIWLLGYKVYPIVHLEFFNINLALKIWGEIKL